MDRPSYISMIKYFLLFFATSLAIANDVVKIKAGEYILPPSKNFYSTKSESSKLMMKDFTIDRYEVSNKRFNKKNISDDEAEFPVVKINYKQADEFCKKEGGKLPTKEEWLVAASYENKEFHPYSTKTYPILDENDLNIIEDRASELEQYGFGAFSDIVEVQEALIGNNSIVGMLGNVWEMTLSDGDYVTLKGGSFYNVESAELLDNRVQSRVLKSLLNQYEHIGFRCVYKK